LPLWCIIHEKDKKGLVDDSQGNDGMPHASPRKIEETVTVKWAARLFEMSHRQQELDESNAMVLIVQVYLGGV
jgi:hypothetical protein